MQIGAPKALLGDPRQAGHLAVAVEGMDAGEDIIGPDLSPRGQIAVTPVRTTAACRG